MTQTTQSRKRSKAVPALHWVLSVFLLQRPSRNLLKSYLRHPSSSFKSWHSFGIQTALLHCSSLCPVINVEAIWPPTEAPFENCWGLKKGTDSLKRSVYVPKKSLVKTEFFHKPNGKPLKSLAIFPKSYPIGLRFPASTFCAVAALVSWYLEALDDPRETLWQVWQLYRLYPTNKHGVASQVASKMDFLKPPSGRRKQRMSRIV